MALPMSPAPQISPPGWQPCCQPVQIPSAFQISPPSNEYYLTHAELHLSKRYPPIQFSKILLELFIIWGRMHQYADDIQLCISFSYESNEMVYIFLQALMDWIRDNQWYIRPKTEILSVGASGSVWVYITCSGRSGIPIKYQINSLQAFRTRFIVEYQSDVYCLKCFYYIGL